MVYSMNNLCFTKHIRPLFFGIFFRSWSTQVSRGLNVQRFYFLIIHKKCFEVLNFEKEILIIIYRSLSRKIYLGIKVLKKEFKVFFKKKVWHVYVILLQVRMTSPALSHLLLQLFYSLTIFCYGRHKISLLIYQCAFRRYVSQPIISNRTPAAQF